MAQANLHQSTSGQTLPRAHIRGLWRAIAILIATWQSRAQQRRELLGLEPWALRDLGISRAEAAAEAAKPFWRP
jgi:uncharacterized protein YjiS (DUF1127 family)